MSDPNSPETPTSTEAERIRRVYANYGETNTSSRLWSRSSGNLEMLDERRERVRELLERAGLWPLGGRRVLDVGCGSGAELAWLAACGAAENALVGVDLLPRNIDAARANYPTLEFHCCSAESLPWEDESFDFIQVFLVFSSILDDAVAMTIAAEMRRVLRPGGAICCYDLRYDNPFNPSVRAVSLSDLAAFFPGFTMASRTLTVLPQLTRRLGRFTRPAYAILRRIPPLRTHRAVLLTKPA